MKSTLRMVSGFSLCLVSWGCGPKATPAVLSPAGGPAAAVLAQPPLDLSPVPPPGQLLARARWQNPDASMEQVKKWLPLPFDWRDALRSVGELDDFVGLVDPQSPVDMVAAFAPQNHDPKAEPLWAISVPLRSLDEARALTAAAGDPAEGASPPGIYPVKQHRKQGGHSRCVVAASAGATPARLVCGGHARDLELLVPYMSRTVPLTPPSESDFHLELHLALLQERYGSLLREAGQVAEMMGPSQLAIGEEKFDRAVAESIHALIGEGLALAGDLDQLDADVTIRASEMTARTRLTLHQKQSWSASTLAEQVGRQAPAPPLFFQMPSDSTTASFAHRAKRERLLGIGKTLSDLIDGYTHHEGLPQADRVALTELIDPKFWNDTDLVGASGRFASTSIAPKSAVEARAVAAIHRLGWRLYAVPEKGDELVTWVKKAALLANRSKFRAFLQQQLAKVTSSKEAGHLLSSFAVRSQPAPAPLPKGSVLYEVRVQIPKEVTAEAGGGPAFPLRMFVAAANDKGRGFLAIGAEREALLQKLSATLGNTGETLAKRRELEPFSREPVISAGFVTAAGILESPSWGDWMAGHTGDASAPSHATVGATTPMVYRVTIGAAPLAPTIEMTVPAASMLELLSVGIQQVLRQAPTPP